MNPVSPESIGFCSKRLGRIRTGMQRYGDEGRQAGLMTLVARRGQVSHFDMVGIMDREAGKALQPDTLFRNYSMTRPITSTAVLMLYEEGHFCLSDPVKENAALRLQ